MVWEYRNTKEFAKGWIGKLTKDQGDAGGWKCVMHNVEGGVWRCGMVDEGERCC